MTPVTDLRAGQVIRHSRALVRGDFEIVSVKVFPNGAVSVRVKMESGMGREFETGLSYRVGEMCEVVGERSVSK